MSLMPSEIPAKTAIHVGQHLPELRKLSTSPPPFHVPSTLPSPPLFSPAHASNGQ